MWDPRRLTTLWVFTTCYRDSFTFLHFLLLLYRKLGAMRMHWFSLCFRACVSLFMSLKTFFYSHKGTHCTHGWCRQRAYSFLMGWDWVHLVLRPLFGLLYQPRMRDDDCRAIGGMKTGRGNPSSRRKSAPVPLCPPQTSHDLTRARTRAAAVGSRRLTRPGSILTFSALLGRYVSGCEAGYTQKQWIRCEYKRSR
jgi:hypothetical protein